MSSSVAASASSAARAAGASDGGVDTALAAAHDASRSFIGTPEGHGYRTSRSGVGMDASWAPLEE
ncbi:hypothetical protein [Streptomyces sp. NPDC060184]|uniref:hypothetical protein n=1 Tax=Streptomyces sp. NPDC060184 TaxID=3347064 RepID=UPI00366143C9